MAAVSTIVAYAALAIGAASFVVGQESARDARRAQSKISAQQKAERAAQAARERRQQIREERVRRARILQAGENTGTEGSSGEFGALGSLATNLNTNLGYNAGALQRASAISIFQQEGANAQGRGQLADGLFGASMSIFSAAGGFGKLDNSFKTDNVANYIKSGIRD